MTSANNLSLPSPPFFTVSNVNNLRDAALASGGLTTSAGQRIRPGILFRSAEVSKLDRNGWRAMKEIGIGHVFDLRSKPEVDKGWKGVTGWGKEGEDAKQGWIEALESAGVDRTWCPVFDEADYSPERLAERYLKYMGENLDGFVEAYHDILTNAGPAFRTIFLYLANLPTINQPSNKALGALIHCTAGKDRTGIFFGILFAFLGVPNSVIADEYQLTELGLSHIREEIVGRLMLSPGFKKYTLSQMSGKELSKEDLTEALTKGAEGADGESLPPEVKEKGRQAALRMVGARKESMLGALNMVAKEFGGAEKYMRDVCGLDDQALQALRRNLLVDA